MRSRAPLRGRLEVTLIMSYPPGTSQRKGYIWRVVNPAVWELARFILPLLQGVVFVSDGQIAKLTITKVDGDAKPLTVITIRALVE